MNLIAAMAKNRVIGKDGELPWRLPDEMKHFVRVTTGHTVVMGRRTFESIGKKPLPNRRNIVLTSDSAYDCPGIEVASSVPAAIQMLEPGEELFVCGGEQAYREAMPLADQLYLTLVHAEVQGDAYFPRFDETKWRLIGETMHPPDERHAYAFTFYHYQRMGVKP